MSEGPTIRPARGIQLDQSEVLVDGQVCRWTGMYNVAFLAGTFFFFLTSNMVTITG